MNKFKIAKMLSILIAFCGVFIATGWVLDIDFLKSIIPGTTTMEFTVAVSFMAASIIIYSLSEENRQSSFIAQAILPAAILLILLLMATEFISILIGTDSGIDDIFFRERAAAASSFSNRPSVATIVNFVYIAIAGILTMINPAKLGKYYFSIGILTALIGISAILGYIFNVKILYFYVANFSNAMAFQTAILFILSGIAMILCKNTEYEKN